MPTVQTGDIATYYEETGAGDPLVLICGIAAELQVWRFQVPELSKYFRVICYDNRGAGRTSAPDEPYTIAQMADDLAAVLDALQVKSAHLLGWSMGGFIAQTFALRYPDRVRKLVLLTAGAHADGFVRLAIRNWVNLRRSDMPYEQIARFVLRWQYTPSVFDNEVLFEKFVQLMVANPHAQKAHAFFRQAEALLAHDPGDVVKGMRAQTLIMAGASDNLVPAYHSERLAQAIPGATLKIMKGAHGGFLEFPEDYNRTIVEFLR